MAEIRAARKSYQRDVGYIARNFSFDTPGIGTAGNIAVGTLPAGCLVTAVYVRVKTAFNAATTNVIKVGTSADDDHFIEAGDVDETVAGLTVSDRNIGEVYTADTAVWVEYTQSGTAATAGEADVVVTYIPVIK